MLDISHHTMNVLRSELVVGTAAIEWCELKVPATMYCNNSVFKIFFSNGVELEIYLLYDSRFIVLNFEWPLLRISCW